MNGRQCVVLGALFGAILVSACTSQVGKQSGSTSSAGGAGPQVVVTPIGHKSSATGGAVAITVRSGADVILSGKDSQPGIAAISSFAWSQTDSNPVALIYLTANTVDFTAPMVAAETTLHFTLAVVDANGNKASAQATVKVEPASDPSQFLTTPVTNPRPRTFQVSVVPQANLPALSADAPICISLQRTINYTTRAGGTGSLTLPAAANAKVDVAWLAAVGGASIANSGALDTAIASYKNPRATFEVPLLNDQDLFAMYNQPQAPNQPPAVEPATTATQRISLQLVPADVDSAYLSLAVTAAPGTCAAPTSSSPLNGAALVVSVVGSDGNSAARFTGGPDDPTSSGIVLASTQGAAAIAAPTLTIQRTDDLLTALAGSNFAETEQTAATYYATIDTMGAAGTPRAMQTLDAWLDANCFDHTAQNYGADSHAVYTNNYDLGFGRDMYFVTCTATNMQKYSPANRVVGDSASVVINYTSLEAAALKQSPFIAVAMANNKYSTSGKTAADRFAKFYVFAPDDRDGKFYLVNSANFDRRGQRYVPGACTGCHGGTVSHATMDAGTSGDLNSAFMPWDVSALLFADTDPAFTGIAIPKKGYNAADQAAAIYSLNQHAYATYLYSDPAKASRFAAPRALIEKWYGGITGTVPTEGANPQSITFASQTFSDAGFPTTEVTGSSTSSWADENTQNHDDLYHNVFAHECRACHAQLDNTAYGSAGAGINFSTYQDFANFLTASTTGPGLSTVLALRHTLMPLARLTADRFWVDYSSGSTSASAATNLAKHAQSVLSVPGLLNAQGNAVPPGAPDISTNVVAGAQIVPAAAPPDPTLIAATRSSTVAVDSTPSFFVANYAWSLCLIPPRAGATMALLGDACVATPMASPTSAVPSFGTSLPGIYRMTLTGISATQVAATQTYDFNVARILPVVPSCSWTVTEGVLNTLNVGSAGSCGAGVTFGDGVNTASFISAPSSWTPTIAATSPTNFIISITPSIGAVSSSIVYQLADSPDNEVAQGTIVVTPVQIPTALSVTYYAYLPLQTVTAVGTDNTSATAQNGSSLAANPLTTNSLSIHVDAACTGTGIPSLTCKYGISAPGDAFTLAFTAVGSTMVAPPNLGPLTIPGTDTISITPASITPVCSYDGVTCTASAPSGAVTYSVTDTTAPGTPSSTGTPQISVDVVQTQSFSHTTTNHNSVFSDLSSACAACHSTISGTPGIGTPAWTTTVADPATTWTALTAPPAVAPATNCNSVAVQVLGSTAPKCVNTTTPTQSQLYVNACVAHAGGEGGPYFTAQQCANLRQWISEGAQEK